MPRKWRGLANPRGCRLARVAQESFSGVAVRARARAGLTQDAVAERMGTTKSAISRLESSGKHAPSLATLKRYAEAVGCDLQVKLVPKAA
ncbi:MAG: helix-turn-helix transcriptional regulator [Betaproteobacteria bacterium]|nr:helix-turn-helix transcriptional regulator [Betaproteobacteria bacterium]